MTIANPGIAHMQVETLSEDGTIIIRRMTLASGEVSEWITAFRRRLTVIVTGNRLGIESVPPM